MKLYRHFSVLLMIITMISCSASDVSQNMVFVAGGTFTMGKKGTQWNPPHKVILSSFWMAKYLVTVGEWKLFLNATGLPFDWDWQDEGMPGPFRDVVPTDDCPAQGLNWYYAIAFCNWLSEKDGLNPAYKVQGDVDAYNGPGFLKPGKTAPTVTWNKTANGYRLPTEAEWEYSARGGQQSHGYSYAGSDNPNEVAIVKKGQTHSYPVGKMKPNELGLFDMTGDVSVWCWDWLSLLDGLLEKNPSVDNIAQIKPVDLNYSKQGKIIRGFDWEYWPTRRVFERGGYPPQNISWTGIRLVRNAQ